MASERTIQRIQAQIQRRIAHCLQFELSDPRASFVTIVRVELNSDMTTAKVLYSVLGDDAEKSKAARMLEHAKGFIRRQVAGILRTKSVPEIRWVFDDSIGEARRMEELIEEARERDEEVRGGAPRGGTPHGSSGDSP